MRAKRVKSRKNFVALVPSLNAIFCIFMQSTHIRASVSALSLQLREGTHKKLWLQSKIRKKVIA